MKTFAVFCLLVVGAYSHSLEHDGDLYDKVDVKKLLSSVEETNTAFDCILEDDKPCSPDHQLIKDVVPSILRNKCGDCTPAQKAIFEESVQILEKSHPEQLKKMIAKFVP